jgi:hypothetical protein
MLSMDYSDVVKSVRSIRGKLADWRPSVEPAPEPQRETVAA